MKRFPILGALLLIPAVMLFGMVGCTSKDGGGKDKAGEKGAEKGPEKGDKSGGKGDDKGGKTSGKKTDITTALEASVTGTVKAKGKAPEMKALDAIAKHADAKVCGMGDVKEQTWIVNNDGFVANAIVILAPPADKKFKLDAEAKKLFTKTVVVDQPFCQYIPHVAAVYPDAQVFVAKNSAKVNHNVKIVAGGDVDKIDVNLTEGKDTGEIRFTGLANESLLDAACSIHSWMNAKVAVFNHPYFAVTNDKGEFKIDNVPVDTELTVYLWHESMGALKSKTEVAKKSFSKGANSLGELSVGK